MLGYLLPLLGVLSLANGLLDTSDCGVIKGCFTNPPNCNAANGECTSAMTYRRLSSGFVSIEMQRVMEGNGTQYIAGGFSNDPRMGDDLVIVCISDDNEGGGIYLSRNKGHASTQLFRDDFIAANLRASTVTSKKGTLYCKTEISIAPQLGRGFPLDHPYWLLLAYGTGVQNSTNGRPTVNRHGLGHAVLPVITTKEINVAASVAQALVSRESPYMHRLRQAHGCLMIIGWWVMSVMAIITARYYKNTWPTVTLGGKAIWFQVHRGLNTILLLCITSAAACMFWANGLKIDSLHAILGLVTIALAWSQPINALARCGPTAVKRPWFNWIHRIIGMSAWILGSVTIFMATFFDTQGLSVAVHGWTPRIFMFIYWSTVALCVITLEALKWLPSNERTDTISMTPINHARIEQDKQSQDNYVLLRTLLYMVMCTMAIVVTVVLCVFIAKYSPRYM